MDKVELTIINTQTTQSASKAIVLKQFTSLQHKLHNISSTTLLIASLSKSNTETLELITHRHLLVSQLRYKMYREA